MSAPPTPARALTRGLLDAIGFVLGAMAGWQLGVLAGFDFIGTPGYGLQQMLGLVIILAGCGVGRWGAQRAARWLERDAP
jgi:hypothetical protein